MIQNVFRIFVPTFDTLVTMKYKAFVLLFTLLTLLIGFSACTEDTINVDENFNLTFSVDTLRFDTIFTEMGSATQKLKIYNTSNQKVRIEQIRLMNANEYHINVSGVQSDDLSDVYLNAKDSLLIFVQVKIDPTLADAPLLVRDSILFSLNQHQQWVQLEAFGQDAVRLQGHVVSEDATFTANKPYLISDTLWVKNGATLTLLPGARLFFRKHAVLYVEGTLQSVGTREHWIELRGDRSDYMNTIPPLSYDLCSGQWGGIVLASGSFNNVLEFTDVRNGDFGIRIDTTTTAQSTLEVKNSMLRNVTGNLLEATNATVYVANSLLYNAGGFVATLCGGNYVWKHCTFANYYQFSWGGRKQSILQYANQVTQADGAVQVYPFSSMMYNSVVYGNYANEVQVNLDETQPELGTYLFHYCLLKQRVNTMTNPPYDLCVFNAKPLFVFESWIEEQPHLYDFHIQSGSAAIGMGDNAVVDASLELDLDGNNRLSDGNCDAGCYEFVE